MYVRYRQVAEYLTTNNSVHSPRVNKASLVIGLLAAFGMTLVANFQVCVYKATATLAYDRGNAFAVWHVTL